MAQRIIQTCDKCRIEVPNEKTSKYIQNYEQIHSVEVKVNNSYTQHHTNFKIDLCFECEKLLFEFLENKVAKSDEK